MQPGIADLSQKAQHRPSPLDPTDAVAANAAVTVLHRPSHSEASKQ
jgi:hypothetical protein